MTAVISDKALDKSILETVINNTMAQIKTHTRINKEMSSTKKK